jgi:hypothetical protein
VPSPSPSTSSSSTIWDTMNIIVTEESEKETADLESLDDGNVDDTPRIISDENDIQTPQFSKTPTLRMEKN